MKKRLLLALVVLTGLLLLTACAMAVDPPALVPKTGQTISYAIGDDGYY